MPEVNRRDHYFDNVKFVLIALVVIGHVLEPLYPTSESAKALYNFIYFFHIPLFVFITGYFSTNSGKLAPYLFLYIIFESLYTLLDYYLNGRSGLQFTFLLPYWVTWYLLAVVLWKIALPHFTKLRHPILIAVCLAVLSGYVSTLGYTLSALRAINFFPFFLAGYYMKREYFDYLFNRTVKIVSALIIILVLVFLFLYGQDINCEWLWGSYTYSKLGSPEWYAGIFRIGTAAVSIMLSISVLSLIPTRRTRISDFGIRTMYPFLLHGFVLKIMAHLGIYRHIGTWSDQLLLILFAVALTVILSMKGVEKVCGFMFKPNLSFLYKKSNVPISRTQNLGS
ncbi:acyltransferase family protein [Paenibacillus silvisoli]|uniref:acyltransferase family protein n=1 Tax=Paenibacillus silvisoli TaxID=3110539 RepID=UPI0028065C83|nr:acyltransferase family protein [Paenibacillus silvisoli]